MPTYVILGNFTQEGIANIKDGPNRLDAAKAASREMGGEILAFYLTMGRYDFVVVTEAPSEEAAAALLLATGSQGRVRTETLRAFTEDEYRSIVAGLP